MDLEELAAALRRTYDRAYGWGDNAFTRGSLDYMGWMAVARMVQDHSDDYVKACAKMSVTVTEVPDGVIVTIRK